MTEPENDASKGTEPEAALDGPGDELEAETSELADDIDEATDEELAAEEEAAAASEAIDAGPLAGADAAGIAAGGRRRATAAAATSAVPERAIRVDDRISKAFVLLTVAVFAAILLNAVFLGVGGVFTPYVSPSPELSASPSAAVSASPSASVSVSPSGSGSAAPSASGSVAPSPSASPAPSTAPSPS
jgi:hypothetical protein